MKINRFLLHAIIVFSSIGNVFAQSPVIIDDAGKPLPKGRCGLGFFAEKVRQKETVSIALLGGSITQGSGASQVSNSYWWIINGTLGKALKEKGSKLRLLHCAVGGTGSDYGAYRVGIQALDKGVDLLVVEFAVNDSGSAENVKNTDPAKSAVASMEGIVRQALKSNPRMGMIFLYTTTKGSVEKYYLNDAVMPSVLKHHEVALRYNIAEVHCGPVIAGKFKAGEFTLEKFFKDGVHPSDTGHALYAKLLSDAITQALDQNAPEKIPAMPEPIIQNNVFSTCRILPLKPLSSNGWTEGKPGYYTYAGCWSSKIAGSEMVIEADGYDLKGLLIVKTTDLEYSGEGAAPAVLTVNGRPDSIPVMYFFPASKEPVGGKLKIKLQAPKNNKEAFSNIAGLLVSKKD